MRRAADDGCDSCPSRQFCLPGGLDEQDGDAVSRQVQWRHSFQRGEHVYRVGDCVGDHLYAVKTGQFKVYREYEVGKTAVMGFRRPGDLLGLDTLACLHQRTSVVALTEAIVCDFSRARLLALVRRSEAVGRQMTSLMSRELAREHGIHWNLYEGDATFKLSRFLLAQREQDMQQGEAGAVLSLAMSRADIGLYLGLAGETVSRVLSRLQQAGYLTITSKHLAFADVPGLAAMCGLPPHGGLTGHGGLAADGSRPS